MAWPPELDGLRIAHLSDFHLGVPSRGRVAGRARRRVGRARAGRISSCATGDLALAPPRPRTLDARSRASTPSPCSGTTTSRSRGIRSPGPPSSRTGCRRRCSWTSRVERSSCAARGSRSRDRAARETSRPVPAPDSEAGLPDAAQPLSGARPRTRRYQLVLAGPHARGPDRAPLSGRKVPLLAHLRARNERGDLPARGGRRSTSRRASARRFSHSASSPGPK